MDKKDLSGKVAVVTGGGRGIGRATAIRLAQAGAAVMVVARTPSEIEETVAQIREAGGKAQAYTADISDWTSMHLLSEETTRTFGLADIVVANASILDPIGDTWQVEPTEWAKNVTINLTGTFNTMRTFLPSMITQMRGVMIFVSSGAAARPIPGWGAYCAAKAGVDHFARTLAAEFDQKEIPIRVHSFYPGVVSTAMQEQIRQTSDKDFAQVDKYRQYHEEGVLRPPEEPAQVIHWLATSFADDLHSEVINIEDAEIRQRIAQDFDEPRLKGRGE